MRKIYFLLNLGLLFTCNLLHAQDNKGTIKGKLTDSAGKQVLSLATVTIFKANDTSIITYRLSDPQGEFKVPGLPLNIECRAMVTYSGFSVWRKEFTLTAEQSQLDFGTIHMMPDSKSLDEVLVTAERPPVTVKKDTIEFNASAFSTLPTALVEDLLKKLPGVQVDAEGNITVNGKRVNRIMVDGRDFFGSDPKMATRNLPANLIDKIQVSEDKDDRDLNPDKPADQISQVINLKLKKAIKKGWFGKAYAGAGNDERYETGALINMFRDTFQISLLGFSNNLNRSSFGITDIRTLGGFDRGGISSMSTYNGPQGSAININGFSFGGTSEGINTSTGAGLNMNHVLGNGLTLNTQYFYGQNRNEIIELNKRTQFFADTVLSTDYVRNELSENYSHRFGFGLRGQLDSTTRIDFKPYFTVTNQDGVRAAVTETSNNFDGLVNNSINNQTTLGKNLNFDQTLSIVKSFKKKGRVLSTYAYLSTAKNDNDQVTESLNAFFKNGFSDTLDQNQLRDRSQQHFSTYLSATFSEPISKSFTVRAGYQGQYSSSKDDIATFNKNASNDKYEIPNTSLTSNVQRINWRNIITTGLNWRYKQLNITAGTNFQFLDLSNNFSKTGNKVAQHYFFVLPQVFMTWKKFNFQYNASAQPPGIQDIQPIPDSTNPLYVVQGNPGLLPSRSHNFNLYYFDNIAAKMVTLNGYISGTFEEDAIVRARTVNSDGSQVTQPVNMDGQHSIFTSFNASKQYKLLNKLQISFGGGTRFNYFRNLLLLNSRRSYVANYSVTPNAFMSLNWKDKIEFSVQYNLGYNESKYENPGFRDLNVNTQSINTELVIRWPKNIVWESSLLYRYNSQAAPGINKSVALLNGGVIFLFLKDQKGNLKLSVYDLLDQNVNIFRNTNENSIVDRQINILTQYFLLTFTYNIRDFKPGKVGGSNRFFRF